VIEQEVLAQVRRVQILASRLVTEAMAGQYESAFKGRGMEFAEVREYQVGDDIRTIDWNVTARTGHPFVREYVEERELTVMLLVDASRSLDVGSRDKTKRQRASLICGVLAFAAILNNDKVGLIVFTDTVELFVPPKKGKRHALRIIREVFAFEPKGRGTNIRDALEYLSRVTKKKSVAFLMSDFLDRGYERDLSIAASRHELVALSIADPSEYRLLSVPAIIRARNPETGETRLIDGRSLAVRQSYEKRAAEQRRVREDMFRRRSIDLVEMLGAENPKRPGTTDDIHPLVDYFRRRELR
jgi:uncharacterized protein (DUF58 family)